MKLKQKIALFSICIMLTTNTIMVTSAPKEMKVSGVAANYASGKPKAALTAISALCTSGAKILAIGGILTGPEAAAFGVLGL